MRAPKSQYPLLGFNSYDCWNSDMDEAKCLANIEAFVKRLKPFGYEYFCIDAGWYLDEYFCERAKKSSADLHAIVDDFGRPQASKRKFPHGIKFISDTCHKNGIKFGIHQMRGIPVEALTKETTIKGTGYKVADIVDKDNVCSWSTRYYGVDMTKPGAQEYYDSIVEYFDENGVDFIKLDDVAEQHNALQITKDVWERKLTGLKTLAKETRERAVGEDSTQSQEQENDYKQLHQQIKKLESNIENLNDVKENPNYTFVKGNICDRNLVYELIKDDLKVGYCIINKNPEDQIKLFITLAQLAGHPVIYDVLPQTSRFSKMVLSNPYIARWLHEKTTLLPEKYLKLKLKYTRLKYLYDKIKLR